MSSGKESGEGGGGRGRDLSFIRLPSISYFITAIQHRLIHTSAPVTANASSALSLGLTFTLPLIPVSPVSVKLVVSTLEVPSGSDRYLPCPPLSLCSSPLASQWLPVAALACLPPCAEPCVTETRYSAQSISHSFQSQVKRNLVPRGSTWPPPNSGWRLSSNRRALHCMGQGFSEEMILKVSLCWGPVPTFSPRVLLSREE